MAFVAHSVLDSRDPARCLRNIACFGEQESSLALPGVNHCEPNAFGQFLPGLGALPPSP